MKKSKWYEFQRLERGPELRDFGIRSYSSLSPGQSMTYSELIVIEEWLNLLTDISMMEYIMKPLTFEWWRNAQRILTQIKNGAKLFVQ